MLDPLKADPRFAALMVRARTESIRLLARMTTGALDDMIAGDVG